MAPSTHKNVFDPHAAVRIFRERWVDMVMDVAFGPFAQLVLEMERSFCVVRMAKRQPKNKAKVFKIRNTGRMLEYHAKVKSSSVSIEYLHQTIDDVLALVKDAYPMHYADVKIRLVALLERWKNTMPTKLVGRDEAAILDYMDLLSEGTENCAMLMLDCEDRVAEVAAKRAANRAK